MTEYFSNYLNIIDEIKKEKDDIYITYLLYRIWIKNKSLIIYANSREEFNNILLLLNIPKEYYNYEIIYPLNNFMKPSNKNKIEGKIRNQMLNLDKKMNDIINKNKNNNINNSDEENELIRDYNNMNKYFADNNTIDKIKKILDFFRSKLDLYFKTIEIPLLQK